MAVKTRPEGKALRLHCRAKAGVGGVVRDQRGQAAVTDALYFLIVVTFLSIFMFGFANTYGNSVKEKISNEYSTTFATNALKTILYSSTPRDPGKTVYDRDAEIDYLLAVIKEDYSDDVELGKAQRKVLGKTISAVMRPIADTKDHIFSITIPKQDLTNKEGKFVFVFFHATNFEEVPGALEGKRLPRSYLVTRTGEPAHIDYFCALGQTNYDDLTQRLSRLFANVGPTSQASGQVKLVQENPTEKGSWFDFKAQADLVAWDAVWLRETTDRPAALFSPAEWNCIKAEP